MSTDVIERHFERIGARAIFRVQSGRKNRLAVSIDIGHDEHGEYFDIAADGRTVRDLSVVDTRPNLRHLLLMSRENSQKHKFLCGHDERHWFVAAVPERAAASNVQTAFEALKPRDVKYELDRRGVRRKKRNRRRNDAFVRQGEWFFVPAEGISFSSLLIFRNEPLRRGAGKPHTCEELVRTGGEVVYVSSTHPNGMTELQYRKALNRRPALRNVQWSVQRRNPGVFVRGRVRHADHKTIVLDGWHRVIMNTETESQAMRHVAFID